MIGVLHLVDGFLVLVLAEFTETPVLQHAVMQKVLVDRRELVPQDLVEMLEDLRVAFHLSPLRQPLASPWQRGSLSRAAYPAYGCRTCRIARPEERRVGKTCVGQCKSRLSPVH